MVFGKTYKLEAFILKRKNLGDGDKALTVYSKEFGKIRLMAKGIRKISSRRAAHLELFNEVTLIVHKGKTWDSISEALLIHQYGQTLMTLSTVSYGYIAFEVIDTMLPDGEKQEKVYTRLQLYMNSLSRVSRDEEGYALLISFLRDILIVLGYITEEAPIRSIYDYIHVIEGVIERKLRTKRMLMQ